MKPRIPSITAANEPDVDLAGRAIVPLVRALKAARLKREARERAQADEKGRHLFAVKQGQVGRFD